MSRDNHNQGYGKMVNNHKKNQMVRDAAREVGISESQLSAEIHNRKGDWDEGDFSYEELKEIARQLKKKW